MKQALKVLKTLEKHKLGPETAQTLIAMHNNPKADKKALAAKLATTTSVIEGRIYHLGDGRKNRKGLGLIKTATARNIAQANALGLVLTPTGKSFIKSMEKIG